jgi:acyl-CoA thioester hydrolase
MHFGDYKHFIPVQVRFSDVDRLNHVNNACYLSYFELGRIHYFNDVFKENIDWNKEGFVLARTETDHLFPVYLNDQIFCFTKVVKTGNKSLLMKSCIIKKEKDTLIECAKGLVTLVAMDYVSKKSIEVPVRWRELISQYED